MWCYFMRGGHIAAFEELTGLSDEAAMSCGGWHARSCQASQAHRWALAYALGACATAYRAITRITAARLDGGSVQKKRPLAKDEPEQRLGRRQARSCFRGDRTLRTMARKHGRGRL